MTREWHEHNKDHWSKSYTIDTLHRLERDIFPKFGSRPVAEVTAPELLTAIHAIENRGAHEVARRMLQLCGKIFRYAVFTGRARYNPSLDMKGALRPVKREHFAAIEIQEIPEFLNTLERNDARLFT